MSSQLPITSATQAKIRLFWTCRVRFSLSRNIIREICLFLSQTMCILHEIEGQFVLFDLRSRSQTHLEIPAYYQSFVETRHFMCVCLGDGQLITCGGVIDSYAIPDTYLISHSHLCRLQNLSHPRAFHALFYDDFRHTVFTFGGAVGMNDKIDTCEKIGIFTKKWSDLPSLIHPKSHIFACRWRQEVYLLGDESREIESFNVSGETFRVLGKVLSPTEVRFAEIVKDEMIVVTNTALAKIRLLDWKIMQIWRGFYFNSSCGVQYPTVFILKSESLTTFDLIEGRDPETEEFSVRE